MAPLLGSRGAFLEVAEFRVHLLLTKVELVVVLTSSLQLLTFLMGTKLDSLMTCDKQNAIANEPLILCQLGCYNQLLHLNTVLRALTKYRERTEYGHRALCFRRAHIGIREAERSKARLRLRKLEEINVANQASTSGPSQQLLSKA